MRYTDEGEISELCKWSVDLSSLPTFQANASIPQMGGFYTGGRFPLPSLCALIKLGFVKNLNSVWNWIVPRSEAFCFTKDKNGGGEFWTGNLTSCRQRLTESE